MENAHIFVLPSFSESFGVALIEAMATGLPVVSTLCGGPEYIVDASNGLLVKPGDSAELTKAMLYIYSNYGKYDPVKIRYDVISKYGQEKISSQYHYLIKSILNEQNIIEQ